MGNDAAITDALRNLIENALVHTPPGTEVVVEVDPKGAISVQDSGLGIPAEDRQRIFERFWRGKGVRTDGAGLGLAIVMEIVRAAVGDVDLGPLSRPTTAAHPQPRELLFMPWSGHSPGRFPAVAVGLLPEYGCRYRTFGLGLLRHFEAKLEALGVTP